MSTTEYHTGELKEIAKDAEGFVNKINRICKERNLTPETMGCEEFPDEYLYPRGSGYKFAYVNNRLFEITSHSEEMDCSDIMKAIPTENGNIDFTLQFYNGGCCFSEALESAISKLNK